MFIDTHAHLSMGKLKGKEKETVQNALNANIWIIIDVGADMESSLTAFENSKTFENVYFSAGIHPSESWKNIDWDIIEKLIQNDKCVAIGECGFDFYYDWYNEQKQEEVFIKQIELSKKYDLPLIIHTRDAGDKTLSMLKKYEVTNFVIHCFTETQKFAEEVLKLWWILSFTGIITYNKTEEIQNVVKTTPLEKIMIETDCPYLAPKSVRGSVNEPKNIPEIALKVSEIKDILLNEVEESTTQNAKTFFNI